MTECCQRTRLVGGPCPAGRPACPHDTPLVHSVTIPLSRYTELPEIEARMKGLEK